MEKKKPNLRPNLRKEIKEKTIGYLLAAFGLVAGLAWNEAMKSLIDFFPHTWNGILIKFVYAIFVTVIVVIITVYFVRLTDKKAP